MILQNSVKIHDCYKYKVTPLLTFDRKSYGKEYYLSNVALAALPDISN